MSRSAQLGPLVRDLIGSDHRFELGHPEMVTGPRVAVVAHWSASPRPTRSVIELVRELQANEYQVVVSSSCQHPDPLEWREPVDVDRLVVLRKPNVGYDFGSWSIGLAAVPAIAEAEHVLLVNDSMAGPFVALQPLLQSFEATPADVWGLTDSYQFDHHLQSYFLGFRGGILRDRALRGFWAGIRHHRDKDEIIHRNELGLARLLRAESYVQLPAFAHELVVTAGENPVIRGWRALLALGFPFVKREILRNPAVAPAGAAAPSVLRRLFGIEIVEWGEEVAG